MDRSRDPCGLRPARDVVISNAAAKTPAQRRHETIVVVILRSSDLGRGAVFEAGDIQARRIHAVKLHVEIGGIARRDIQLESVHAEVNARLFALLLREAGIIKLTPQKIMAESTDWRFLDELKRELKA